MADHADADSILEHWKEKYGLPDAHVDYFVKEVEDALDHKHQSEDANPLAEIESWARDTEYLLDQKVGSGAFGSVYRGRRKRDNQVVAIKVIDLEETKDDIMTINREITALTQGAMCSQLTKYFGSAVFGTKLWIVMEYVDGGSVFDRLKERGPLKEKYIAVIVREVLIGLRYLAMEKKIHRDIKAANILLSRSGEVKLADFGATGQLTDTMTKCNTFVGSPYWMAPEVMTQSRYDGKADIWSLGITCLELAKGKPPLCNIHPLKVITIIPNQPAPQLDGDFSRDFKNFVALCLIKDPKKRPSIDLLLKHPFIKRAGPTSSLKKLWSDDSDDEEESLDMPSGADNVIHNEDQMTTKHPQARPGMSSFDEQDEDEKDS